ncbi:formate dehydrogenase major subunit [Roseivivax marinus]|uniref:formate dehydrogenase subunit alpha n=1 Tax=Roseivivax marinus TaxID=1379903 RepID=UPI0008CF391E|nr:formate dehydrogenase subunit alpha [Roseivivax marinus]SEL70442.1 formate dehydrogenase major subunit [Roseivivax marinus]
MLKRRTGPRAARPAFSAGPDRAGFDRRSFLKRSGLTIGGLSAIGASGGLVARAQEQDEPSHANVPEASRHKTICPFCSVGCSIWAEVRDGVWVGQEPAFESPINQGTHCAKGAATREVALGERRLKYPLKRQNGEWVRLSWEQALDEIGSELMRIREEHGPDAVEWLGSAKFSNEMSYLFRKFAALWGTNNVDHQARICHSTTVAGVANTFGYGAMTNSFNDIRKSKSIIIIGGNPAEAHPVSMLHVLNGKENGAKLIVVDPRFTRTAAHADEFVRIRPGADVGFMWGLAKIIFDNGWEDEGFLRQRVFGIEKIREEASHWTEEEVERVSGIPPEQLHRIARTLAENRPGTLVWCMGLTQSTIGNNKTRAASVLQLILGNIGVSGGGTNIFRGHDNVQGATDLGVSCDTLPAYYGLNEGAWKHWGRVWDLDYDWLKGRFASKDLMEAPGIPVSRWMDGVLEEGEALDQPAPLKAVVFWGHASNSQTRGPDRKAAWKASDLIVVVDPYPTQTAVDADLEDGMYLLPSGTTLEMAGSVTNSNRSIQWREKVINPVFEAKADTEIIYRFADRLGFASEMFKHIAVDDGVPSPEDTLREINRGTWTIGYTGASPERLKAHMEQQDRFDSITLQAKGGSIDGDYYCLPWPSWGTPAQGHPGTPLLYDVSKPVSEGGLPFRARWGVEHEGQNLLAEDSWTKGSEIEDGYPEITVNMLEALGWANELTDREKLMIVAVAADRFRWDMFEMSDDDVSGAMRALEEAVRNEQSGDGAPAQVDGSWQNSSPDGGDRMPPDEARSFFPNYPDNALTAIEAYLQANIQNEPTDGMSLSEKIARVNWKTDLSGGVQRVAIAHGLAPFGNGKARAVVWTFPDEVPLHREPLYTNRRDLLPEYQTFEDRRVWRLPSLYRSVQEVDHSQEFPLALTSGRLVEFEGGGDETRSNPWLAEFQQQMFAEINPKDAADAGIEDGGWVWVATPVGRIKVSAMVTNRVGPGTVFVPFHFAGMWMGEVHYDRYPEGAMPYVHGEAANTAQTYGYDVVTQMQETKATLCRVEKA